MSKDKIVIFNKCKIDNFDVEIGYNRDVELNECDINTINFYLEESCYTQLEFNNCCISNVNFKALETEPTLLLSQIQKDVISGKVKF